MAATRVHHRGAQSAILAPALLQCLMIDPPYAYRQDRTTKSFGRVLDTVEQRQTAVIN